MKKLPRAKNENVVVQQLDKELLIYDLITNQAFCLNESSAVVFNACNGETTFEELKTKHKFTEELIFLAIDELKKESLLADDSFQSPFVGMSRREVVKKVGFTTMIALPIISTIIAPTAALAQSSCLALTVSCSSGPECCSTCCNSGTCVTTGSLANGSPCSSNCACASTVCDLGVTNTCIAPGGVGGGGGAAAT